MGPEFGVGGIRDPDVRYSTHEVVEKGNFGIPMASPDANKDYENPRDPQDLGCIQKRTSSIFPNET